MARELISSRLSYRLLKFGMPATFFGFGILVSILIVAQGLGAPVLIEGDNPRIRVLLIVTVPLAVVALAAWLWDLKYVELEGNRLLVSGVRRRIVVPLTDVASVRQNFIEPGHPIYVDLKTPGEFGTTFSFVPAALYAAWTPGPGPSLVERLRDLAGIHA